jgi:hypothetical protein
LVRGFVFVMMAVPLRPPSPSRGMRGAAAVSDSPLARSYGIPPRTMAFQFARPASADAIRAMLAQRRASANV